MNNVGAHSDFAHVRATDSRVQSLSRDYPNSWNTYVFESKCSGGLGVSDTYWVCILISDESFRILIYHFFSEI